MNNTNQLQKVNELVERAHEVLSSKYGVNVKDILNNSNFNTRQKHNVLSSKLRTAFCVKHQISPEIISDDSQVGSPFPWTDTVWVTPTVAKQWNADSGKAIEDAIEYVQNALDSEESGDFQALGITTTVLGGILGVGSAWVGGVMAGMGGALAAANTAGIAALAAGSGLAAAGGAAALSASAAATSAGLGATAAASAAAAAEAAFIASGGTVVASTSAGFGGLATFGSAMLTFAITPPAGPIIVGVAVLIAVSAFLVWLLTRDHNFTGIIINNTDNPLTLNGGNTNSTGLFTYEGSMPYFPGIIDETDPHNPILKSTGLPARLPIGTDKCIPVGLFAAEGNEGGKGSVGWFSLTDSLNNYIVCLYANNLAGYASGVNISMDPLTDTQENIYKKYYGTRSLRATPTHNVGDPYYLTASCDGPGGGEAYGIFCITEEDLV